MGLFLWIDGDCVIVVCVVLGGVGLVVLCLLWIECLFEGEIVLEGFFVCVGVEVCSEIELIFDVCGVVDYCLCFVENVLCCFGFEVFVEREGESFL